MYEEEDILGILHEFRDRFGRLMLKCAMLLCSEVDDVEWEYFEECVYRFVKDLVCYAHYKDLGTLSRSEYKVLVNRFILYLIDDGKERVGREDFTLEVLDDQKRGKHNYYASLSSDFKLFLVQRAANLFSSKLDYSRVFKAFEEVKKYE